MYDRTPIAPRAVMAMGCALALAGCGSSGLLGRERPDEFAVQRQAPLVIPPDFELVPPAPGAPRPTEGTAAEQALDALFGEPEMSAIEASAFRRMAAPEPGIRSTVGDPGTHTVDKGNLTRTIIAAPEGDGQAARAVIPG